MPCYMASNGVMPLQNTDPCCGLCSWLASSAAECAEPSSGSPYGRNPCFTTLEVPLQPSRKFTRMGKGRGLDHGRRGFTSRLSG
jgi:hypothetical protein